MNEFWFAPKTYGYGATPVTWEGWVCVAIYVAVVAAVGSWFSAREKVFSTWAVFFATIAIATAVLVIVSVAKTNGSWHWRWGQDNSRKAD